MIEIAPSQAQPFAERVKSSEQSMFARHHDAELKEVPLQLEPDECECERLNVTSCSSLLPNWSCDRVLVRTATFTRVHQYDFRKDGKDEKVRLSLTKPCDAMDRSRESTTYSDKSWHGIYFHTVSNSAVSRLAT